MRRSSRTRPPAQLSDSLCRKLNLYALAAGTAGLALGTPALSQPAEAKIIYTKCHKVIGRGGVPGYSLDLNHDAITDFVFDWSQGGERTALVARDVAENLLVARSGYVTPLNAGVRVGPRAQFSHATDALMLGAKGDCYQSTYLSWSGEWWNLKNRYVGLKFFIDSKVHYGWARFTVKADKKGITAILTGYAYETIAKKSIRTGNTAAPDSITVQPASLGLLARGASGISTWRATAVD